MIPHTVVLKPGLVIHSVYSGYWFWGRPSIYELWYDLRAATAEIRPDWDLSTPGLREAWDAGDYSKFHGWDRRSPQSTPICYEPQDSGCCCPAGPGDSPGHGLRQLRRPCGAAGCGYRGADPGSCRQLAPRVHRGS
jgi:hypothetical protein